LWNELADELDKDIKVFKEFINLFNSSTTPTMETMVKVAQGFSETVRDLIGAKIREADTATTQMEVALLNLKAVSEIFKGMDDSVPAAPTKAASPTPATTTPDDS
jgi:hypothetical protein